jgi:hypothetical protein
MLNFLISPLTWAKQVSQHRPQGAITVLMVSVVMVHLLYVTDFWLVFVLAIADTKQKWHKRHLER